MTYIDFFPIFSRPLFFILLGRELQIIVVLLFEVNATKLSNSIFLDLFQFYSLFGRRQLYASTIRGGKLLLRVLEKKSSKRSGGEEW